MKNRRFDTPDSVIENFMGRSTKWIVMFIVFLLVIFPLYWLIGTSIKPEVQFLSYPPAMFPTQPTAENYQRVFGDGTVFRALYNSGVVAILSTLFSVLFGNLAAYALVKGKLGKSRNILAFWFLVQKMYPAIAMAIPIYLSMRSLKLFDTQLSLIIINTSFSLPLVIWLMMGFFREVPAAIEESGKMDGCSMTQRFFLLIFPIAKPGIIASSILTFVNVWNEFLFAVILTGRKAKTLPIIIAGYITDRGLDWGPMAATGVIIILPVLILVWVMQKDFVKGLVMGSVKG